MILEALFRSLSMRDTTNGPLGVGRLAPGKEPLGSTPGTYVNRYSFSRHRLILSRQLTLTYDESAQVSHSGPTRKFASPRETRFGTKEDAKTTLEVMGLMDKYVTSHPEIFTQEACDWADGVLSQFAKYADVAYFIVAFYVKFQTKKQLQITKEDGTSAPLRVFDVVKNWWTIVPWDSKDPDLSILVQPRNFMFGGETFDEIDEVDYLILALYGAPILDTHGTRSPREWYLKLGSSVEEVIAALEVAFGKLVQLHESNIPLERTNSVDPTSKIDVYERLLLLRKQTYTLGVETWPYSEEGKKKEKKRVAVMQVVGSEAEAARQTSFAVVPTTATAKLKALDAAAAALAPAAPAAAVLTEEEFKGMFGKKKKQKLAPKQASVTVKEEEEEEEEAEEEEEEEEDETEEFCAICRLPTVPLYQCDGCERWFHADCAKKAKEKPRAEGDTAVDGENYKYKQKWFCHEDNCYEYRKLTREALREGAVEALMKEKPQPPDDPRGLPPGESKHYASPELYEAAVAKYKEKTRLYRESPPYLKYQRELLAFETLVTSTFGIDALSLVQDMSEEEKQANEELIKAGTMSDTKPLTAAQKLARLEREIVAKRELERTEFNDREIDSVKNKSVAQNLDEDDASDSEDDINNADPDKVEFESVNSRGSLDDPWLVDDLAEEEGNVVVPEEEEEEGATAMLGAEDEEDGSSPDEDYIPIEEESEEIASEDEDADEVSEADVV